MGGLGNSGALSTGGKAAQGDFAGTGAGLLTPDDCRSDGPFCEDSPILACCLSAFAPNFRIVAFGPTELVGVVAKGLALGGSVVSTVATGIGFVSIPD